jgi:hypothetical protein
MRPFNNINHYLLKILHPYNMVNGGGGINHYA